VRGPIAHQITADQSIRRLIALEAMHLAYLLLTYIAYITLSMHIACLYLQDMSLGLLWHGPPFSRSPAVHSNTLRLKKLSLRGKVMSKLFAQHFISYMLVA